MNIAQYTHWQISSLDKYTVTAFCDISTEHPIRQASKSRLLSFYLCIYPANYFHIATQIAWKYFMRSIKTRTVNIHPPIGGTNETIQVPFLIDIDADLTHENETQSNHSARSSLSTLFITFHIHHKVAASISSSCFHQVASNPHCHHIVVVLCFSKWEISPLMTFPQLYSISVWDDSQW